MITLSSLTHLSCNEQLVHTLGRVYHIRSHGRLTFVDLAHNGSVVQLAFDQQSPITPFVHLGSWLDVEGVWRLSRRGEPTLWVQRFALCNSPSRPLEEQPAHGTAPEQRYLLDPSQLRQALMRSHLLRHLRDHLWRDEFVELETPILHHSASGAAARPFFTYARALQSDMFLRVAPETHLVRMMAAGVARGFEVARSFRNEGLSHRHQPEFTLLEVYQAGARMHQSIDHVGALIAHALERCGIDPSQAPYRQHFLNWYNPRVVALTDIVQEHTGCRTTSECQGWLTNHGHPLPLHEEECVVQVFEHAVEAQLIQPTFVHGYPVSISPLAREENGVAQRFELFAGGMELANGFEQNIDVEAQRARFAQQANRQDRNDIMPEDEEYLFAMGWGLPPIGGFGIGIDRLVMLGFNLPSIRDAVLFPM